MDRDRTIPASACYTEPSHAYTRVQRDRPAGPADMAAYRHQFLSGRLASKAKRPHAKLISRKDAKLDPVYSLTKPKANVFEDNCQGVEKIRCSVYDGEPSYETKSFCRTRGDPIPTRES